MPKEKKMPTVEQVIAYSKKYMSDVKGKDNDLFSMFRKQFIDVIEFAQGKKSK